MVPRGEMMALLTAFQSEDPSALFVGSTGKIQRENEIPVGEDFDKTFHLDTDKGGDKYLKATIETWEKLGDIK